MAEYREGDRVRIVIDDVQISDTSHIRVAVTTKDDNVWVLPPHAAIELIVPAEWPPRAGDLWRDRHGELWFFYANPSVMQPEPELLGRTAGGARWTDDIPDLLRSGNDPWTLVRREEMATDA